MALTRGARALLWLACLGLIGCGPLAQTTAGPAAGPAKEAAVKEAPAKAGSDAKPAAGPERAAKAPAGKKAPPPASKQPPPPVTTVVREPYLRMELPGQYRVRTGGPADPGLLLRAERSPGKAVVVVRARPLAAPMLAPELGPAFLGRDQDRLRRRLPGAETGPVVRPSVAGRAALGYSYRADGQDYRRLLVPAGEWLYEITFGPASPDAPPPWLLLDLPKPEQLTAVPSPEPKDEVARVRAWAYTLNPPELQRARELVRELRSKRPRDPELISLQAEVTALQALTLKRLGGEAEPVPWPKVRAWAVGAWRRHPEDAQALRGLGLAKLMEGDEAGARKYLKPAAKRNPPDAGACLAMALLEQGQPARAEAWARQALKASPGLIGARLALVWALEDQGKADQTSELYQAVLARDPDNRPALLGLARGMMDRPRELDRAGLLLARLSELDPKSQSVRFDLALVRFRQKRYAQAEELAAQVARARPGDAAALNLLGLTQAAQKRRQEARASYQAALAADPEHVPALFNLGVLCATELDDAPCAREAFQRFLSLEPNSARAEKVRAWLVRHGG